MNRCLVHHGDTVHDDREVPTWVVCLERGAEFGEAVAPNQTRGVTLSRESWMCS